MKLALLCLIIFLDILNRVFPHIPNFSPSTVFALYLGMKCSKKIAYLAILTMTMLSDFILHLEFHWPMIGNWTFFTYSALIMISSTGYLFKQSGYGHSFFLNCVNSSLFYWLWTNAGTWLISPLYPHSFSGFISCYIMALPFLTWALIGSLFWSSMISIMEYYFEIIKYKEPLYKKMSLANL